MSEPAQPPQSTPSPTVILLNLPASADEAQLRTFLVAVGAQVDEVTIIRDHETGYSRRFGFVRFGDPAQPR